MSLAIDVDTVTAVQLSDGWHTVAFEDGISTFSLDAYEYLWNHNNSRGDFTTLHGGGDNGICSTGFDFKEGEEWVTGPLTEIRAVKYKR